LLYGEDRHGPVRDPRAMVLHKTLIFLVFLLIGLFCAKNIQEDVALLGERTPMEVWLFWCAAPILFFVSGMLSRNHEAVRRALLVGAYYLIWTTIFAFNGSAADEGGMGHIHFYLIPAVMLGFIGFPFHIANVWNRWSE